ncbi:hypothetical protein CASFOL_019856 [Castilleja foliolosa]|uniref:Bifunctional inhibitor/plant lipid transfer protein/seed storage helical domain-containing protein n=1 Tax=Castilleja foliolosa TaxID=1961234 RepID=A0ABD3D0I2_9LAMI
MPIICLINELALFFMVFAAAVSAENPAKAPAPAADCQQQLMSLTSCLSYVMKGSIRTEPERPCCEGLSTVLATTNGPMCLCGSFDASGLQGVQVNASRALSLPKDCSITNYPSAAECRSLKKLDVPPPSSTVVENPPAADDTAANPGSSVSSSPIVCSVKLLIRTAPAIAVLFIY